jgi:hypothetical protein
MWFHPCGALTGPPALLARTGSGGARGGPAGAVPGGVPPDASLFANLHQHVLINPSLGAEQHAQGRAVPCRAGRAAPPRGRHGAVYMDVRVRAHSLFTCARLPRAPQATSASGWASSATCPPPWTAPSARSSHPWWSAP